MIKLSEHNTIFFGLGKPVKRLKLSKVYFRPPSNMEDDAYTTLLDLKLFHNSVPLILLRRLKKDFGDFDGTKNVEILKTEGHWGKL